MRATKKTNSGTYKKIGLTGRLESLIQRRYSPKQHPQFFKKDGSSDIEAFSKATRELRLKEINQHLEQRAKERGYPDVETLLERDSEMRPHKEMIQKLSSDFWAGFGKKSAIKGMSMSLIKPKLTIPKVKPKGDLMLPTPVR